MTPEDNELWKKVTNNVTPLGQSDEGDCSPMHVDFSPQLWSSDTIDLHGMTLKQAHGSVVSFIRLSRIRGIKSVTVITGKSGLICREFPLWCESIPSIRSVSMMANGGSYIVQLQRPV